jgi:hypothetical protein
MNKLLKFAIAPLALLIAPSITAADKAAPLDPVYDTATVVTIAGTVTEIREVPTDQPMRGLHLILRADSETLDVYVGPAEFVKIFDVIFKKGDNLKVIGSKVATANGAVVLAREVTLGTITLLCRDNNGAPLWQYYIKPPVG